MPSEDSPNQPSTGWKVISLDDALVVVNKPAGLPTLPDGYHPEAPCLKRLLDESFGRVWTVHRLDKETSGVIVFARSAEAHRLLNSQFDERQTVKTYHALVDGEPTWEEREVDQPLLPDGDRQHRTVVDYSAGKPAMTSFRVMERLQVCALLEARPHTGRTHQIRAHLVWLGNPLTMDRLYGSRKPRPFSELLAEVPGRLPLLERPGLHAWSLELAHPMTGERVGFQAPYPSDFENTLDLLRKACQG
jgi:tRNA pseudouridine32 synthase/23S rRNA pseudouridine746 synthase